jgi:hypothetical protein
MAEEVKKTDNPTVYKKAFKRKRGEFSCPFCKPHRVENASRKPRHVAWKDKGKTKYKPVNICGPTIKDAWEEGWKIGQHLAAQGVDERALHGGEIRKWQRWYYYFPMNSEVTLFQVPDRLPKKKYQEFLDGVIDGFENNP